MQTLINHRYRLKALSAASLLVTGTALLLPGAQLAQLESWLAFVLNWDNTDPQPGLVNDKVVHAVLFFCCALSSLWAWVSRPQQVRITLGYLGLFALITELLQHFVPGRSMSLLDLVADAIGIGLAALLCAKHGAFQVRLEMSPG